MGRTEDDMEVGKVDEGAEEPYIVRRLGSTREPQLFQLEEKGHHERDEGESGKGRRDRLEYLSGFPQLGGCIGEC
jgi:hypothetical protein